MTSGNTKKISMPSSDGVRKASAALFRRRWIVEATGVSPPGA